MHLFHQKCIDTWFIKGQNSCPLCKHDLIEERPVEAKLPGPEPVHSSVGASTVLDAEASEGGSGIYLHSPASGFIEGRESSRALMGRVRNSGVQQHRTD
jgi:hypothetical protein